MLFPLTEVVEIAAFFFQTEELPGWVRWEE
jgi:hypothetical protein